MPIVIQPTPMGQKMMNKKMDKMGGGGMDIPMKKKMKMSGKMEDMREYMDRLDAIEEDTTNEATWPKSDDDESAPQVGDTVMHDKHGLVKVLKITDTDMMGEPAEYVVQTKGGAKNISYDQLVMGESVEEDTLDEGAFKDMMIDVEDGMSKEEFEKEYPGMGAEYDKIKKEIMDRPNEDVQEPIEDTVSENSIMDPETKKMIPEKDYVMKYVMAKHPEETKKLLQSGDLMDIYGGDLYNALFDYMSDEMPYGTQKGRDGDPVQYMQDELDSIGILGEPTSKFDMYNRKPAESVDEQDIEMEEDCGCDDEAIDAMVSVPVQELQDILQLAGYENYADKIQEYANEPEEEYSSVEDQMIGLSGGLNGPKKMYPASADGDNPMNQEPREIEENTMEAVEEKLYKSYKDFLEEAEVEVDEEITKGTGKKGLEKSLDKLYGPKKGSTKKVDKD